jgi:hypothetical protein
MVRRRKLGLWRVLALAVLCIAGFAGAAVAGNPGNGNGGNGNSGNPPGQQKQEDPQQQAPQSQQAPSQNSFSGNSANANAKPKSKPAAAKKQPAPSGSSNTAGNSGKQKTNGQKVLICHKTGSATNPYVVISISINGWVNGHSKHPGDIFLGPSYPGDHRKDASLCVSGGTTSTTTTTTGSTSTTTGSTTTTTHQTTTTTGSTTTTTGSTTTTTSSTSTTAAVAGAQHSNGSGGVAGGQAGLKTSSGPLGGVLGATAQLGAVAKSGHLPFTGFPLWAAALIALVLIGLGLALRRGSRPFGSY